LLRTRVLFWKEKSTAYCQNKRNHRRRQKIFGEDAILLDTSKKVGTSISYERYPTYSKFQ
ncbi:hypothetical protein, partial [Delftia tsuruhatensis]|uniref:hypothetical protein n=1 Tax=Delftia tsuruhatensis TaxID=180282 RepID=UPI001F3885E5